jgi:copper transport protein
VALPLTFFSVLLLCVTLSLSGHPVAQQNKILSVAADSIHVLCAGAWLGSLFFVASLILSRRAAPGEEAETASEKLRVVQSFSPLALGCAAVVALTGGISAIPHFRSVQELFTSQYGKALLFKLAAVGLVLLMGFLNWKRNTGRILSDNGAAMRGGAWRELAATVLVLLMTSALVVTPPPVEQ